MVTSILPLVIEGAVLRRHGQRILGPIDLTLDGKGITIVMGPNGSGKTSLLRLMHGLERPRGGLVRWQGQTRDAHTRQAFVFQTPTMMRRNVVDSIAYPMRLRGVSRRNARAKAADIATQVGLGCILERPAHVLSGGERQKLALARALISHPQVLFLDEPCANLDLHATRDIEGILNRVRAEGTRIVMSTHHIAQARRLADDILFMSDGRVLERTIAAQFFANPGSAEARAHLKGDLPP